MIMHRLISVKLVTNKDGKCHSLEFLCPEDDLDSTLEDLILDWVIENDYSDEPASYSFTYELKSLRSLPVQQAPCRTCPFAGEEPIQLGPEAMADCLRNVNSFGNHFCHSVPQSMAICRGGRNITIQKLFAIGFISVPTDEAFNHWVKEMEMAKDGQRIPLSELWDAIEQEVNHDDT
jgi:hypothetical protein